MSRCRASVDRSEVRLLILFLASACIVSPAPAARAFPPELAEELEAVLARYQAAVPRQHQAMLGANIVTDYEARFTELHEQGRWRLLKSISRVGDVTFRAISAFTGDDRVRKELILRSMEEEQKSRAFGAIPVTASDYQFSINAILRKGSSTIYVYDVKPRRKAVGLFEGQVEIDGATGMPLRESGRLVKSPHWILSNVRFRREYELHGGISVVKYFESRVNVRFLGLGQAEVIARYSDYQPAGEQPATGQTL